MTDLRFRAAVASDATAFSAITGGPHDPRRWAILESTLSRSLIAERAQRIPVGLLEARHTGDDVEIVMLFTATAERRCGVASGLLNALIARVGSGLAKRIILDVAEDNIPARQLYATKGFAEIARRPGYYPAPAKGQRSDALLLARWFDSARVWE